MKRSYLYLLTLLCTCALTLFSCRKDIDFFLEGKESPTASVLENAKIHYLQNVNIESNNRLGANWKDSWIINKDGREILIVPAPEIQQNNKNFSLRRFFAFRMKNEQVQNVNILELLGKGFDVEKNIDLLVSSVGNKIDGFNGSILLYDINYYPQKSYIYENGQVQKNKEASIASISKLNMNDSSTILKRARTGQSIKSANNVKATNCPPVGATWGNTVPPMADDCTVTIYTETITNIVGCVIRVTYYYQSHTCPAVCTSCGSGSGSGGGSGSGSGSGNNGSGGGGNPPYGGGGDTTPSPKDLEPSNYNYRLKLSGDWGDHLTMTTPQYILDANGNEVPNANAFNCHYHAFKDNATGTLADMGMPKWVTSINLNNYSKVTGSVSIGDRVMYFAPLTSANGTSIAQGWTHSAIVIEVDAQGYATKVSSKMGEYQILEHHPRDVPQAYGPTNATYSVGNNTYESRIYYRKN